MRVAAFFLLLLVALGYAARRGGGPERVMAGVAIVMVASDPILHRFVPLGYASLDFGHLVIDGFGATSTLSLALIAHRFWPLIAAALPLLTLIAPLTRASDLSIHPSASMLLQDPWSWL